MDPMDLRLINAMETGDEIPDVAVISSCGFKESLEKVREMSGWDEKRKEKKPGRGIGVGCYSFISGGVFNWFNTKYNFASCEVRLYEDGTAHLLTMAADIGQGSDTVLRQILSAELGISIEKIRLTAGDTALTPQGRSGHLGQPGDPHGRKRSPGRGPQDKENADPGGLCRVRPEPDTRHRLRPGPGVRQGPAERGLSLAQCAYKALRGRRGEPLCARGFYTPRGKGLVTPAFSFGAQVAEVQVDEGTGRVEVKQMYTAHDCGVPINKTAVEGQLEGSIHMGLGYALSENLVMQDGRTLNTTFLDYKIPTAEDMPPSLSVEVETYEPEGPFGAKEAGEGLVSPTAPAIAEAVHHAVGFRCRDLPLTPGKALARFRQIEGIKALKGPRRNHLLDIGYLL